MHNAIKDAYPITIFKSKEAAEAMLARMGAAADEYTLTPRPGWPGHYLIECLDPVDGFRLGFL